MDSFFIYILLCFWLHLCLVFPLFSELLVKLAGGRSLRQAPKRFLPLGPLANGIEINANESTIHNNNTAERTKYDETTIIMTRFTRKSNSEEDVTGFSSPYLCSRVVLNSGHPVQKSKCGACAVTGYCLPCAMFWATCLAMHFARQIAQVFTLSNGMVWLRNKRESCLKSLQKVEPFSAFCNLSRNVFGRWKVCHTVSCFVRVVS